MPMKRRMNAIVSLALRERPNEQPKRGDEPQALLRKPWIMGSFCERSWTAKPEKPKHPLTVFCDPSVIVAPVQSAVSQTPPAYCEPPKAKPKQPPTLKYELLSETIMHTVLVYCCLYDGGVGGDGAGGGDDVVEPVVVPDVPEDNVTSLNTGIAGSGVTMVPLDVTERTPVTPIWAGPATGNDAGTVAVAEVKSRGWYGVTLGSVGVVTGSTVVATKVTGATVEPLPAAVRPLYAKLGRRASHAARPAEFHAATPVLNFLMLSPRTSLIAEITKIMPMIVRIGPVQRQQQMPLKILLPHSLAVSHASLGAGQIVRRPLPAPVPVPLPMGG
eukprot:Amastigsp_a676210_1479.p2 type:complete len:330 gc:universal Amastigsp_a676210_1479:1024-35(-)